MIIVNVRRPPVVWPCIGSLPGSGLRRLPGRRSPWGDMPLKMPPPPDGHVAILMGDKDRRTDGLVSTAGRIGARRWRPIWEHRPGSAPRDEKTSCRRRGDRHKISPARGQFHAGTLHQPYQWNVQALGQVGDTQNVLVLAGQPSAGHYLVVEPDDNGPFTGDLSDAVHDVRCSLRVLFRIVQGVEGMPRAGVDEVGSIVARRSTVPGH